MLLPPHRRRAALWSGVAVTMALTTVLAVPSPAAAGTLAWTACTDEELIGFDCATTRVPLDHDAPRGATTTIALAQRPADDPARRIGTIFVNPGGPGSSGRNRVAVADRLVAPEVLARFDVVGFDPRGVGASDPVQCFPTEAEAVALLSQIRLVPLTAAEIAATLRANAAYAQGCRRNAGPLLAHMSTLNVAKDLDLLRQAVGDDRLNYLGYSYGTLIGATYVNLFPGKVRAVVLNGNVDPDQRTNRRLANKFDRSGGFELALAGFLRECDAAGPHCALAGNARARVDALRERFRQGPVELPEDGTLTMDDLTRLMFDAMENVTQFPRTAEILRGLYDVLFGGATTLAAGGPGFPRETAVHRWAADAYAFNSWDAALAVNCADAPLPRDPALYPGFAEAFEAARPTYGRAEAFSEVACATWPRTEERYHGPWNRRTAQTVLLVNATYDPAARHDFAVRMSRQLGNARLLTLDGFGHIARFSSCVTDWYTRYLVDGAVPRAGTRCSQDVAPFPAAPEPAS